MSYQYDQTKNSRVYQIDPKKLRKDQCHFFYRTVSSEEHLVATALEFFTFHPWTQKADEFECSHFKCRDMLFYWCSFPKEFQDVCERAAKVYEMRICHAKMTYKKDYKEKVPQLPALKLAEDYKRRNIVMDKPDQRPVSKDALEPYVKKEPSTTVLFPKQDNILWFQGKRCKDLDFDKRTYETYAIANYLHQLGVD